MTATQIKHKLMVIKKIQETPDAVSLILKIPDNKKDLFHYKPGQFLTVFLNINGNEIARSYSFSSSPIADENLKISIKRVTNGLGSNYLIDQVEEGQELEVSPPAGHFFNMSQTIEDELEYLMFAAGSGITPLISIIKWSLPHLIKHKIHLIYSNKTPESTLFLSELDQLEEQYPHFKITYLFSRREEKAQRLTQSEIELLFDSSFMSNTQKSVYMCGPVTYMEMIEAAATKRGLGKEWIHQESFFSTPLAEGATDMAKSLGIFIGDLPDDYQEVSCQTLIADIDGNEVTVTGNSDEPVLETLLEQGHTPPFSCMSGTCQACMCKLIEGNVLQEDEGILTEEQIKERYFLSCQARPVSKTVKIRFIDG